MSRRVLMLASIALLSAVPLGAEHWPQWRGPRLNGVSAETNLPVKWGTKENVTWSLPLPERSGATPIIWGDHLFLNTGEGGPNLALWSINRNTGAVQWKRPLGAGNRRVMKQQMSSPSPVTDGRTVWVMTGTGLLRAFDFAGKELWLRDLQRDYGPFGINHGYASSPLLHDDSLFVQVLHGFTTDDPSYVLRIDKASGKTLWRVERPTMARVESPTPRRRCCSTRGRRRLSSPAATW